MVWLLFPLMLDEATLVHLYLVGVMFELKTKPAPCSLQIVVELTERTGLGVTVTVNVKGEPWQPLAVGVMV